MSANLHLIKNFKNTFEIKKMKTLQLLLLLVTTTTFSQKIPVIDLENLDGETVSSSIFTAKEDKIKIITFWATWCIPCLNELSSISEVYEDWKSKYEFDFYAISIDDDRTVRKVAPLTNGKNWPYTILLDTNQDFKRNLNINTIPHLIMVKNGEIIYTKNGFVKGDESKIEEVLSKKVD